jgi:hypothetical protein
MVAMGGFKEQLGRLVDGKEPLDWDQFWEVGIGKSDVLPFIGDLYKNVSDGFHSKGIYGAEQGVRQFVQDFFLPPALGVAAQWPSATVGWSRVVSGNRSKVSRSEANAMKSSLVYNNAFGLSFLLNKLKTLLGTKKQRSNGRKVGKN